MLSKIIQLVLFLLLFLGVRIDLCAQNYNFEYFSNDDGLAQSQVSEIMQDSKGYLWIGTYGGLSRYNGHSFTNFSIDKGLPGNIITSILETSKGELLVGTASGLCKKMFSDTFAIIPELSSERIEDIIEDKDGNIWIGTLTKLIVYDGVSYKDYNSNKRLKGLGILSIFQSSDNAIWLATNKNKVLKYVNGKFNVFEVPAKKTRSIIEDNNGQILIGTENGLFVLYDGVFKMRKLLGEVAVRSLVIDKFDNLWISTIEKGVYYKKGEKYIQISTKNGLSNNSVLRLFFDKEANLWIGTYGGLNKFKNFLFVNYKIEKGLPILSIVKDEDDNIWFGTFGKGIYRYKSSNGEDFNLNLTNSKLNNNKVWTMCKADNDVIWIGTSRGINKMINNKVFRVDGLKNEFKENSVYHIANYNDGDIWFCTRAGIIRYNSGKFKYYTEQDGLLNNFVWTSYKDSKGNYWFGTTSGVSMFDGKKFSNILSENEILKGDILSIVEDDKGNIWFANYGKGVAMYDTKSKVIETFLKIDGLKNESVALLEFNTKGELLIGSNGGLDKLYVSEFYESGKKEFKFYDAKEGFFGQECNQNASFKDDEGNIWIGTIKGVNKYDERYDTKNILEPQTLIEYISINNNPFIDSSQNIELAFNQNKIHFEWVGISLTAPEKVTYKYMMEGVDEDWNPISNKTEITYPKLPPGDYVFKVKAANNDGVWNKEPVTFSFTIHPPWYYSNLAIFSYFILIIAFVYGFVKYRMAKVLKEKKVLEEKVEERTQELRKEKEKVEEVNKEVLNQKAIIEEKNKDITDSINYAKQIQEALLPPQEDIEKAFKDSFVLFMPKDIVSGDFYWFVQHEDTVFIAAVDCTGHGVPGAFMSLLGDTALNQVINHSRISKPSEILNNLNNQIRRLLRQESEESESRDGMDIALCAIDLKNNKISFSGAYRPLFHMRDGLIEEIKADRFPIGGYQIEEKNFTNKEIKIKSGDCIYMFSDGIVDQFGGEKGKKFLSKRFKEILEMNHNKKMKEQYEIIKNNFITWRSDYEQIDDVLVIGIRF